MKAATMAAISSSSQMEGSRAVAGTPKQQNSMADGSRMDVEGRRERRVPKFEDTKHETMNNDEIINGGEWMPMENKEMNSEVRHCRIPSDELRQKHHWKRTKVTRNCGSDHTRIVRWDP